MTTLSTQAENLLISYQNNHVPVDRISWDHFFIDIAFKCAIRSHDTQTKHGCVLVNKDNEIISTGYNGLPRRINDKLLPNTRPDKYDWMIHAEANAVYSCARQGKSTQNCTAYVTGHPCLNCLLLMWQVGIRYIVHAGQKSKMMEDQKYQAKIEVFKYVTGISIREIKYN